MILECDDGWKKLYQPIIDRCVEKNIPIFQIKEKFGGLRIYTDRPDDEIDSMISDAEHESFSICEYCGSPGKLRTDRSWMKTLCDACNVL